jgi:hypothetical protein
MFWGFDEEEPDLLWRCFPKNPDIFEAHSSQAYICQFQKAGYKLIWAEANPERIAKI